MRALTAQRAAAFAPRALLAALALGVSGCSAMLEACYVGCVMAPKHWATRPPKDKSTLHCQQAPGRVYRAENGDQITFHERDLEWKRGPVVDNRDWTCRHEQTIEIEGMRERAIFSKYQEGILLVSREPYRLVVGGTSQPFDCELPPGRTFVAPNGDRLEFAADGPVVRWIGPAGARTASWTCAKGVITLRDGDLQSLCYFNREAPQYGFPHRIRWNGVEYRERKDP